jgi:transcriptional regulator with XRE-family HTH domain
MEQLDLDLGYVAGVSRQLRQWHGWTQENLADAAHLTARTIQKVESGHDGTSEETLRRIAKAFGSDVRVFHKQSQVEERAFWRDVEREIRKSVLVKVWPVEGAQDVMRLGHCHMLQIDTSEMTDEEALSSVAKVADYLSDVFDLDDIPLAHKVDFARDIARDCNELVQLGYRCYLGKYRQVLTKGPASPLNFDVGLVTFRATSDGPLEHALVQLQGSWEAHPDDRRPLTGMLREAGAPAQERVPQREAV